MYVICYYIILQVLYRAFSAALWNTLPKNIQPTNLFLRLSVDLLTSLPSLHFMIPLVSKYILIFYLYRNLFFTLWSIFEYLEKCFTSYYYYLNSNIVSAIVLLLLLSLPASLPIAVSLPHSQVIIILIPATNTSSRTSSYIRYILNNRCLYTFIYIACVCMWSRMH